MKRNKKQIGQRLLDEVELREKKSNSPSNEFINRNIEMAREDIEREKDNREINNTDYIYHLFEDVIKKTMVDVLDYDKEGFLHIKINPNTPSDIRNYLIGKAIEGFNEKIYIHYRRTKSQDPDLKLKDFIDRHYPQFPYGLSPVCKNHDPNAIEITKDPHDPSFKRKFRPEQNKALEVWAERRLRKPFKQIAKKLKIKEPACKKMFYKAYELLYGKKYNPADYEKPEIKKRYLKRECGTCKDATCNVLCPDVIKFVNQDNREYLREYLHP
jgi:hypothetical protein